MFPEHKNSIVEAIKERMSKPDYTEPLVSLLQTLEDYTPTIPDGALVHYLHNTGFDSSDPRIIRIIALVVQKFISDIANDSLQQCKIRTTLSQSNKVNKPKDRRYQLTMEDLAPTLSEFGIGVRKAPYFV